MTSYRTLYLGDGAHAEIWPDGSVNLFTMSTTMRMVAKVRLTFPQLNKLMEAFGKDLMGAYFVEAAKKIKDELEERYED